MGGLAVRTVRSLALLAVAGLSLGACGERDRPGAADTKASRAGGPGPAVGPSSGAFVRGCRSRVEGGTIDPDPQRDVVIGPVTLTGLREPTRSADEYTMPAHRLRQLLAGPASREWPLRERRFLERAIRAGRPLYPGVKVLALVREGATATVAIAPADRGHASLLYDQLPSRHSAIFEVADGEDAVTFRACPGFLPRREARRVCGWKPYKACLGANTQFNGGFVVAGPRCVMLEVWTPGARRPLRREVGFGVRC